MAAKGERISEDWRIPDSLWERMEPLLPKTEATTPLSRAQAVGVAASDGWHLLRAAYRVPVESRSPRVWFRQQLAPLLPATCGCGLVREALETGVGGIRRVERYSVGMAVHRRGDDQGTAGRGKKPGPIPRIGPSRVPSAPCLPMVPVSRWEWRSAAPTRTTSGWLRRPCRAFR